MKAVQIHEIEFDSNNQAEKTSNYPHGGLFIAKIKNSVSDVRFVDLAISQSIAIAPAEIFKGVTQSDVIDYKEPKKEYSQDFILEFARILLNRNHV